MAEKTRDQEQELQRFWTTLWLFRRRLLVSVGLGVAGVVLLIFGAYRLWSMIAVTSSDIRRERTGLERSQQRANLITSITPEMRENYETVNRALPLFKDPLLVLRSVEAVANDTSVSLSEFEFSPGVVSTDSASLITTERRRRDERPAQQLTLKFDMSGTFQELTNAVAAFEESLPLIEVIDININPSRSVTTGSAVGAGIEYTATLQIDAFYAQVDAKAASQQGAARLTPAQEEVLTRLQGMQFRAGAAVPAGTASSSGTPRSSSGDLFGIQSGLAGEGAL